MVIQVISAIMPVFLIAGMAYWIRKAFMLDARTLATLNIYLFIPALIFDGISKGELEWSLFGRFTVAMVIALSVMSLLLLGVAHIRKMPTDLRSAFLMTMFANLGNFGIPVVAFAFGREEALPLAVVVMVCGSFFQNSLGIFFAHRSRYSGMAALSHVFRFPMIYTFTAAILFQRMDWSFPLAVSRAIEITANAAIPVQLIILGAKVAETRLDASIDVFLASGIRLVVGPVIAYGAAWVAGLDALALKIFVMQLSGPVAVGIAVYGVQFDVRPGYLASVVTWTSLMSAGTAAVVLAALYAL